MRTSPARTSATAVVPVVVISSRPSPWTTRACSLPRSRSTRATFSTRSAAKTPINWRFAPAGFVKGPSTLNSVRTPSSRRTGMTWAIAGWSMGANRKAMPTSSRQRPSASVSPESCTPRASSTSAEPERLDTARLPCLATRAPPAAATRAAAVEMLKVPRPSPPVPQVSITPELVCGTPAARARIARAAPAISPTDSPFAASATRNALFHTSDSSPSISLPNSSSTVVAGRSWPAIAVRNRVERSRSVIGLSTQDPESSEVAAVRCA